MIWLGSPAMVVNTLERIRLSAKGSMPQIPQSGAAVLGNSWKHTGI